MSKCSVTRTISYSTRFTAYEIIYFGLNCCLCYKAARKNAGACRSESRTNTFSVMAASICMQTFYPSPRLNPCFLSFWFHLHFLHRIFLGIYDKWFSTLKCCQNLRNKYSIPRRVQQFIVKLLKLSHSSGFWPFFITHCGTVFSTFRDWYRPIAMRPHGWEVPIPHSPAIMQISVSWLKLSSSLSDVYCWRTCGMRSSFNNAFCVPK